MSWLWKSDTSSPASFEKALSKLSGQISSANSSLETTRSRGRRVKALWTLYTTLTYLLYTLIITLILGPRNWGIPHYAGLVGAPVVVYAVRTGITLVVDWRASRQQRYVDGLQKQRDEKIAALKKATKYDSTQELLQKYGGAPKQTPSKQPQQGTKRKINPPPQPARTGIAPPPTANIQGRSPFTPQRTPSTNTGTSQRFISSATHSPASPDQPGFAPNAFSVPASSSNYQQQPQWYDRILDLLMGEDETLAKHRLVLICEKCRLVNGQAPPGVKTLEELGKWRCASCGAWNGLENEVVKVAKEIAMEKQKSDPEWEKTSREAAKEDREDLDPPAEVGMKDEQGSKTPVSDDGSEDDEKHDKQYSKPVTRSASKTVESDG